MGNIAGSIIAAGVPAVVNGISSLFTGISNRSYYQRMQEKANAFAREERQLAQNYNSLENQFAQMQAVGLNPNLLTGNAFVASSPMPNQSVAPPQMTPPQLPADSFSQALVSKSQSANLDANTMTEDLLRDNRFIQSFAEIRLTDSQADLNKALRDMSVSERENLFRTFRQMDAKTEEIYANTRHINQQTEFGKVQTFGQQLQNAITSAYGFRTAEANWRKIVQETAVDAEQANFLKANTSLAYEMVGLRQKENKLFHDTYKDRVHMFQFDSKGKQIGLKILRTNADKLEFEFNQIKDYDDLERCTRLANGFLDAVGKLQNVNPVDRMADKNLDRLGKLSPFTKGTDPVLSSPYGNGSFGD